MVNMLPTGTNATMTPPRLQWVPSVPVHSPPCDVRRKPPPSWVDDVRLELGVLGRHCLPTNVPSFPPILAVHLSNPNISCPNNSILKKWWHLSPSAPNGISAHPVLPRATHGTTMECQVCKMKQKLGVEQDLHVSILDCNGTPAHYNFNMDLLQLCNS